MLIKNTIELAPILSDVTAGLNTGATRLLQFCQQIQFSKQRVKAARKKGLSISPNFGILDKICKNGRQMQEAGVFSKHQICIFWDVTLLST